MDRKHPKSPSKNPPESKTNRTRKFYILKPYDSSSYSISPMSTNEPASQAENPSGAHLKQKIKYAHEPTFIAITHITYFPVLTKPMLTHSFTKMRLHQSDIQTILCHQRIMTPFFHYPSSIKHYNIVHVPHHCSSMRY